MKKCFHFSTWEEIDGNNFIISGNNKFIVINNEDQFADHGSNVFTNNYGCQEHQSTPSDPILAEICKLTGAKMYKDYVVLDGVVGLKNGGTPAEYEKHLQGNIYKILMQQDNPIEERNRVIKS